jgi:hypothetical protein
MLAMRLKDVFVVEEAAGEGIDGIGDDGEGEGVGEVGGEAGGDDLDEVAGFGGEVEFVVEGADDGEGGKGLSTGELVRC